MMISQVVGLIMLLVTIVSLLIHNHLLKNRLQDRRNDIILLNSQIRGQNKLIHDYCIGANDAERKLEKIKSILEQG